MKNKFIIALLISLLSCVLITACKKQEPIPTVESIVEETTVEIETTTEEVNALKSDPSIQVFNSKQGTVEGYEATEESTEEESTGGTDIELTEDDYQGEDFEEETTNEEVVDELVEELTDDEIIQQMIDEFIEEHSQYGYEEVDVPGLTPGDPSQDGQYHLGQGGEVPDDLKGDFIN